MRRKYAKSPLVEVICELRFSSDDPYDLTVPGVFWERLQEKGYSKQLQSEGSDLVGFLRDDEQAIIQVAPHLLSVHRLKPYESWEEFRDTISLALNTYFPIAKPRQIQSLVLRYVNRVEIQGNKVTLEDYFEFYPQVGKDLPQDHAAFIAGVQIPFEEPPGVLRLQLASARETTEGYMAMILDIAFGLATEVEATPDLIIAWLEGAHKRVEEAFEGSIRDTLRLLFEEVNQ